jgi:hypothetical protein
VTWSGVLPAPAAATGEISGTFLARTADGALLVAPSSGEIVTVAADERTRFIVIPTDNSPVRPGTAPLRGDMITARRGADGVAAEVTAIYRLIDGVVAEARPVSPLTMPSVVLDDGERHVIDLYAPLHGTDGDATPRALPVGTAFLRPGDTVRLRIQPETGRVFELWKQAPGGSPNQVGGKGDGS